eukprot:gnl/MRDRNA2_/MRDRNA2_97774_c0_seq1.p1 gnl/MRDRNA2_/MRDRNA2_97774_c0~~gnl/MRDRNA2_/MRDRNA2_97774_c0_seq1.p1  ORF type:complete len:381 (+),score=53.15 gnl/MRDRNA2_/MRDRNA2_97774_c0_seq1:76-1218(+)
MSITGLKVPTVEVERWKEALLVLDGKRCAPPGLKHLPGTTGRSMSQGVLCGPGSTPNILRRQNSSRHRKEESRRRKQIRRNPAQAPWNDPSFVPSPPATTADGNRRPSTSPCITVPGQAGETLEVPPGRGGHVHGSKIMEPDAIGYDPVKHGWYHPKGRAAQARLKATGNQEEASWEWDIRKAKDHIGFPARDVGRGHVIKTHVSSAGPDWFLSVKMDKAPNGGSRLPSCGIKSLGEKPQDAALYMKQRIFEKGLNLSVRERGERPSTAVSIPGSVRSISAPKQTERPASAPTGSLFNTAPGQTSVTFDDWRGTYQDHLKTGNRCLHGYTHCDFDPCHSHQGWRTRSDMVAGAAVAKQKRAPYSTYVGIDARYPGPNENY